MRLFIAINFDDGVKDKIQEVQSEMKKISKGNYSKRDNLHLTLAFLGEIEEARLKDIKDAMNKISVPKMNLTFSEVGCFKRDQELWWIGLKHNENLSKLQSQLSDELMKKGFKLEKRKFIPHITIARQTRMGRAFEGFSLNEFDANVSTVDLMLSSRIDGKLVYTKLYSV